MRPKKRETPLDPSRWVWCGMAGHMIASDSCLLHLNTRVGNYRVSTIGCYRPPVPYERGREKEDQDVGYNRKHETYVFPVKGRGEHGEGAVTDWCEIDSKGYTDMFDAERGHIAMCKKWARYL